MDLFIQDIAIRIQAGGIQAGYNWTMAVQASPTVQVWNRRPLAIVCPSRTNPVSYNAFGCVAVQSSYDCFLVTEANLVGAIAGIHDAFTFVGVDKFTPTPTIYNGGSLNNKCFKCRPEPMYDYDRKLFPAGARVTAFQVKIDWIFKEYQSPMDQARV